MAKRYAELTCNGLEAKIKNLAITKLKSMMLLNIMWNVALKNQHIDEEHPRMAFCLYFSLDDTNNELMPRIIAMDQHLQINQVLFPKSLEGDMPLIQRREAGFQNLRDNVHYFAMKDAAHGSTIEYIEETIDKYIQQLETLYPGAYQLVAFIDNFHDIVVAKDGYTEENTKFDYISGRLTEICNTRMVPIMCSAEFKKISAHKRPEEADIKSTGLVARLAA